MTNYLAGLNLKRSYNRGNATVFHLTSPHFAGFATLWREGKGWAAYPATAGKGRISLMTSPTLHGMILAVVTFERDNATRDGAGNPRPTKAQRRLAEIYAGAKKI